MIQKFKFLSKRTNSCEQNDEYNDDDDNNNNNHSHSIASGSEKKLISRNDVICSSGKDKYRHDSERADVPLRPVNSELEYVSENNNHLKVNPIHSSRQSMFCTNDFASTSSLCPSYSQLSRQNSTASQVVKRNTVVNRLDLEPSLMINGKFQNPWPNYKSPTFTNILKLGISRDKSNVASKKVKFTTSIAIMIKK